MEIDCQFKEINEVLRFPTAHERLNARATERVRFLTPSGSSSADCAHQRDMYGMKLPSPTSE
jgi:hypothetical protein